MSNIKKRRKKRTERRKRFKAKLHIRQHFVHSHLCRELREKLKKRAVRVRKGDRVRILRGEFSKKEGKVAKVDLKKSKVFIEGIKRRRARGQEVFIPIDPSNILILEIVERK